MWPTELVSKVTRIYKHVRRLERIFTEHNPYVVVPSLLQYQLAILHDPSSRLITADRRWGGIRKESLSRVMTA